MIGTTEQLCPCCGRVVPWWPEADAEALRGFVTRGLSGGQIVRKFGGRYTRQSILAKAARMKLTRPARLTGGNGPLSCFPPAPVGVCELPTLTERSA